MVPAAVVVQCNACSAHELKSAKSFKLCSGCHATRYCNKACQQLDWNKHKITCIRPDISVTVLMRKLRKDLVDGQWDSQIALHTNRHTRGVVLVDAHGDDVIFSFVCISDLNMLGTLGPSSQDAIKTYNMNEQVALLIQVKMHQANTWLRDVVLFVGI